MPRAGAGTSPRRLVVATAALAVLAAAAFATLARPGSLQAMAAVRGATVGLAVGAGGLCLLHRRDVDAPRRTSWSLLAAACFAWAAGAVAKVVEPPGASFPSMADGGHLLFIPLAAGAVLASVRAPHAGMPRLRTVLDGLLVAGTTCFMAYVFFLRRIAHTHPIDLVYPGADICLTAIVIVALPRAPRTSLAALGWSTLAILLIATSDVVRALATAGGTYSEGTWTDLGWPAAFGLLAWNSTRPTPTPYPRHPDPLPAPSVYLPMVPFIASTLVAIGVYIQEGNLEPFLFWLAIAVIAVLTTRQLAVLHENNRLRDDIQAALERLQEQEALRTRLLHNISHDLRNPLVPILAQLELLSMGHSLNADDRRRLEVVRRNIAQVQRLVGDLSDVLKLQDRNLRLIPAPLDASELAREVVDLLRPLADEQGITLTVDSHDPTPLEGDRDRLRQVILNLVGNALKFTPAGGQVNVRLQRRGAGLRLVVSDTGRGLSREERQRLFLPFSQVHDPSETTERGSGLGLYISKGLVEQHGGRLWVESDGRGKGSAFHVELPERAPALPSGPESTAVSASPS